MKTEFEMVSRIVFWGDEFHPHNFASVLGLDKRYTKVKEKGEVSKNEGKSQSVIRAKTGRLIYSLDQENIEDRRHPEIQFERLIKVITKLPNDFRNEYHIDDVQVQISLYYKDKINGDVDFIIPNGLTSRLSKHNIEMRFTLLP